MKKGLILALFALVSVVSYSQITWSGKVGMNMSNFTGDMETDMRVGFNVGVGAEYQFTDLWSLHSGLMFSQKGAKAEVSEEGITATTKFNPMYLQIPVMAGVRFNVMDNQNVVVKFGPYIGVGIAGKCKVDISGDLGGYSAEEIFDYLGVENDVSLYGDDGLGMKRFDFGLGVGVAYEFDKFFVGLDGEFGLVKLADGDGAPRNINFSIGVGYKF